MPNEMVIKRTWNQRDQSEVPLQFYKQFPNMHPRWGAYKSERLNVLLGKGWQVVHMKESDIMTIVDPLRSTVDENRNSDTGKKSNKGFSDPQNKGGQVGTVVRNGDLILLKIPKKMWAEREEYLKSYTDEMSGKNKKKLFQSTAEEIGEKINQEIPTFVKDVDPDKIRKEVRKFG